MIISKQSNILSANSEHRVFLSLGSNVGNSLESLDQAIFWLIDSGIIELIKKSSIYLTEPWGYKSQNWFYNMAIKGQTEFSVYELITFVKTIEVYLGRRIRQHWTERELDIDLLFYDNIILQNPKLTIPHPQIENRRFVLTPMDEIAPDYIHPLLNLSIHKILLNCKDNLKVIRKDEI